HFNPYSSRGVQHGEPLIVHGGNGNPHPVVRPRTPDHNVRQESSTPVSAYDGNLHSHLSSAPTARVAPSAPRTTLAPGLTYSGTDGSVYRQTPSAGWQRNTGSTWQTVPRTQAPALEQHAVS